VFDFAEAIFQGRSRGLPLDLSGLSGRDRVVEAASQSPKLLFRSRPGLECAGCGVRRRLQFLHACLESRALLCERLPGGAELRCHGVELLTAGALLALLLPHLKTKNVFRHPDLLASLSLLAIALCSWHFHLESTDAITFGITVVELAAVALIYVCLVPERSVLRLLFAHPVTSYVGKVSYGIYLWHYPLFVYLWGRYPWYVVLFGGGLAAFTLAVISYHSVEAVARRYSRKLRVRDTPAPAAILSQPG